MNKEKFWDEIYIKYPTLNVDENESDLSALSAASKYFGDLENSRLLDLGCGNGQSSLFFARQGANVVSIDTSAKAIDNLSRFCAENNIDNITSIQMSAFDIADLGKFDFIFGNMILHHLEPFEQFSDVLRKSVNSGGKAFFHENNAYSNLLIWFRENLVGKYGIPKYGDEDEFPLMPKEVDALKRNFAVDVVYPKMVFFGLVSIYLLKRRWHKQAINLDNFFFKFPKFRKYSYRQYLLLS